MNPEARCGGPRSRWLEALGVTALIGLGLGLRLLFVTHMQENPLHHEPVMDSEVHVAWARALASGREFAPFADRPFFRAPLYVWWLAGVFWLFGDSLLVPRLLQCGLGAASVGLVYLVGRRAWDTRVGLLAALWAATDWVLIYFDSELLIPTLIVPLNLLALWLALGYARSGRVGQAAGAGLVWGLSAIARPNVLLFAPLFALWFLLQRARSWRHGLAAAAGFSAAVLVPILPITAHNTFARGDFVLISSQAGLNFWIGNNPYSDGVTAVAPGTSATWWQGYRDVIAQAEQAEGRPLRASEVSQHYSRRAWDFLLNSPEQSLPLLAKKLGLFWTAHEYANNTDIHFFAHHFSWVPRLSLGFAVLAPLGLLGFALSLRDPRLFPLWGFLIVYTLGVVAFFVNSRYRVPVLPVLMLFAARALVWGGENLRERRWGPVALALVFALGFGAWSTWRAPRAGLGANGYVQLALAESRRGNFDASVELIRRALERDPDHVDALVRLGWAERIRENPEAALGHFRRALRREPLRTDALEGLLDTLVSQGQHDRAEQWITRYLELVRRAELESQPEVPYYYLGRIHAARGAPESAAAAFREALRRDPNSARSWLGLGNLARGQQRLGDAIAAYSRAAERLGLDSPDDDRVYRQLVRTLAEAGRDRQACRRASEWSRRRPELAEARRTRDERCAGIGGTTPD